MGLSCCGKSFTAIRVILCKTHGSLLYKLFFWNGQTGGLVGTQSTWFSRSSSYGSQDLRVGLRFQITLGKPIFSSHKGCDKSGHLHRLWYHLMPAAFHRSKMNPYV
jgi:hypothetical protein